MRLAVGFDDSLWDNRKGRRLGTVGSSYYSGRAVVNNGHGRSHSVMVRRLAALAVLMVLLATTILSVTPMLGKKADAWVWADIACGDDLGYNTAKKDYDKGILEAAGESVHETKFPLQVLYGRTIAWTTYNGSKHPDNMQETFPNKLNSDPPDYVKKNSGDIHKAAPCWGRMAGTFFAGILLRASSGISNLSDFFVTKAVDPNFICQDPKNTANVSCINLLAVIAGDGMSGSDGGIIGRLYSGLYLGLIVFAWACVALWAIWNGLFKRKLVSTLSAIGVSFIIFFLGVVFMSQPLLIAQLPMKFGTAAGACVIEGVNGVNCMSENSANPNSEPTVGTECFVDANAVSAPDALTLIAKQATCKIWKAFVMEPWAQGQFGESYEALYDKTGEHEAGKIFQNPDTKDVMNEDWSKTGDDPSVSLYAASGDPLDTCSDPNTKYRYKNLALYQLNVQSSIHDCNGNNGDHKTYHSSDTIATDGRVYQDWYYIIKAMTATMKTAGKGDQDISYMYHNWTGTYWGHRLGVGLLSLVASFGGALILITTSVLAIMYLFTSVLLTAFAPLFFLIGVVPGTGKKIFLGWVEQVVSATLKYFACILWMMVTVELYGAVLGSSGGMGATLVFVLIVTLAMWFYRGEFINMMGSANFGGKKLSSKMGDWMKDKARKAGKFAAITGTSRVIGTIKGNPADTQSYRGKGFKDRVKTAGHNARSRWRAGKNQGRRAAARQLSRGNGVIGNATRTMVGIDRARRNEMKAKSDHTLNKLNKATNNTRKNIVDTKVKHDMANWDKGNPGADAKTRAAQEKIFRDKANKDVNAAYVDVKTAQTERDKVTGAGSKQSQTVRDHAAVESAVNKKVEGKQNDFVNGTLDSASTSVLASNFKNTADFTAAQADYKTYQALQAKKNSAPKSFSQDEQAKMDAIESSQGFKDLEKGFDSIHDNVRADEIGAALRAQAGPGGTAPAGAATDVDIKAWDNSLAYAQKDINEANQKYDETMEMDADIESLKNLERLTNLAASNNSRLTAYGDTMGTSNSRMNSISDADEAVNEFIDEDGNIIDRNALDTAGGTSSSAHETIRPITRTTRNAGRAGRAAASVSRKAGRKVGHGAAHIWNHFNPAHPININP